MADTVSITLGANVSGAVGGLQQFSRAADAANKSMNKFANAFSSVGGAVGSIGSALGVDKLSNFVGSANQAVNVIASLRQELTLLTAIRLGAWTIAAAQAFEALSEGAGLFFDSRELSKSSDSLKQLNEQLAETIRKTVEFKVASGQLSREQGFGILQSAIAANGEVGKPESEINRDLIAVSKDLRNASGIGKEEALKAELQISQLTLSMSVDVQDRLSNLKERLALIKQLGSMTNSVAFSGEGGVSGLAMPDERTTKKKLEDLQKIIPLLQERAQIEREISEIQRSESLFLNDLAATAAGAVQTALAGVADGIVGLIQGTRTWAQAFQQTASSILSMVIQLVLRFTVLYGLVSALQAIFRGSSFVAKFAGFAGFPGKATGGLIGSGVYQVGERGPEYVINNSTLARMGSGFFDALQSGYSPRVAQVPIGSGGGALTPGGGAGGAPAVNFAAFNSHHAAQQWAESRDGRTYLVDMMTQVVRASR